MRSAGYTGAHEMVARENRRDGPSDSLKEWVENDEGGLREREGGHEFGGAITSLGTQPPSHEPTCASTSSLLANTVSTLPMLTLLPQTMT